MDTMEIDTVKVNILYILDLIRYSVTLWLSPLGKMNLANKLNMEISLHLDYYLIF